MIYSCSQCTEVTTKWIGQCPKCGAWNCMRPQNERAQRVPTAEGRSPLPRRASDIPSVEENVYSTGIRSWDKVLGGGMGMGSILVAGEPGVGKTTHVIYAACNIAHTLRGEALFLSGEMLAPLVATMGRRLNSRLEAMLVHETTSVDAAEEVCLQVRPAVIITDSIQAFYCDSGESGMIVEVARRFIALGQRLGAMVWLISQLNKEGEPEGRRKVLHAVDTVMHLEMGVAKTGKNRFRPGNQETPWAFGKVD